MDSYYYGGNKPASKKIIIGAIVGVALLVIIIVIAVVASSKSKAAPAAAPAAASAAAAPPAAPLPPPSAPATRSSSPPPPPPPPAAVSKQLTGCESDQAVLKCDSGMIKGGSIRYGRWNNSICPHPTVSASTSPKDKTYQMYDGCLNKPTCTLGNYNSTLQEDIYPNVYKHWEINYQCQ